MSQHLPRTRPSRPALRRAPDRVQFGLDPRSAVHVEGLSDVASAALLHLDGTTSRSDALRLAPELSGVLHELHQRGTLDDAPEAAAGPSRRPQLAPDLAAIALSLESTALARHLVDQRARAVIAVRGNDRTAALIAVGLAAAGVGTVALEGPERETTLADLTPVGPFEAHVPWRDSVAEAVRRQGAHPVRHVARPPALTVVSSAADADLPWCDPELDDDLSADGLPHLPVAVAGARARIGPLVVPGTTECLWCLDRRSCDLDPAWPALTDQLRLRHPVARSHCLSTAMAAAACVVSQVLHALDEGPLAPITNGAMLELSSPHHLPRVIPTSRHPVCGCGWEQLGRTMGA